MVAFTAHQVNQVLVERIRQVMCYGRSREAHEVTSRHFVFLVIDPGDTFA